MPKGIYTRVLPAKRRGFEHNEAWLREQYEVLGKGSSHIATELGVSNTCIQYWMKKFGIQARDSNDKRYTERRRELGYARRKYSQITKEFLESEYLTGKKTLNQIASEIGCSWDTVRKQIVRHGFPMRWDCRKGRSGIKRTTTQGRRFQKKVLKKFGYKCVICGYDKFVNCHHIDNFAKSRNDSSDNGIVLCPNHHAEADYGIISPDELREYADKYIKTQSELYGNIERPAEMTGPSNDVTK
jgi:transposase